MADLEGMDQELAERLRAAKAAMQALEARLFGEEDVDFFTRLAYVNEGRDDSDELRAAYETFANAALERIKEILMIAQAAALAENVVNALQAETTAEKAADSQRRQERIRVIVQTLKAEGFDLFSLLWDLPLEQHVLPAQN